MWQQLRDECLLDKARSNSEKKSLQKKTQIEASVVGALVIHRQVTGLVYKVSSMTTIATRRSLVKTKQNKTNRQTNKKQEKKKKRTQVV